MKHFERMMVALALSTCVACGDSGSTTTVDAGRNDSGTRDGATSDGGTTDDGGNTTRDGGEGDDAGQEDDAGSSTEEDAGLSNDDAGGGAAFMAIAPCGAPGDYVDTGTVSIVDRSYDPPCLEVAPGTTLTIPASRAHPLQQRTGGSPENPFPDSEVTRDTEITFDTPGFYPYQCTNHASDGMIAVIHVVPR